MQKFGLFDVIEKFLPLAKAVSDKTQSQEKPPKNDAQKTKTTKKITSSRSDITPYYALIKRHDEISKRIDKANKKLP